MACDQVDAPFLIATTAAVLAVVAFIVLQRGFGVLDDVPVLSPAPVFPREWLVWLALGGMLLTLGAIFLQGMTGLYCLIGISACMSLMFPTIYGIALQGLGEDAKFGAAGLIMAILGGSVLPPVQGAITDLGEIGSMSAVRASFVLPLTCFVVIALDGFRAYRSHAEPAT